MNPASTTMVPSNIKQLYDQLTNGNHSGIVRFSMGECYPNAEKIVGKQKRYEEGLIIRTNYSSHESFLIATFEQEPIRALYQGQSAHSMLNTLRALNLPDHWPNNFGENLFFLFKESLEDVDDGPACIEQIIHCTDLTPLKPVLERLVQIYLEYGQK